VDAVDEFLDLLSALSVAGGEGGAGAEAGGGGGAGGEGGTAADPGTGREPAGTDPGPGPAATVHLHATDAGPGLSAEWLVTMDPPTFHWRHAHEKADVAVRAPLADVLRVVTRRLSPDAESVEVHGDRAVLEAWLEHLRLQ
jgi:hypothetical protein